MKTKECVAQLKSLGIDHRTSRYLLKEVAGVSNFLLDPEVPDSTCRKIFRYAKKISTGYPVQYALGYSYFYKNKFKVNRHVLIPRFDTERLVEEALKYIEPTSRVLDCCTGSGCVGLSILCEKHCDMTLSDISRGALRVAKSNAKSLHLDPHITRSDMLSDLTKYDVIVCNPPYIKSGDIASLDSAVQHEPILALDGDVDGLKYYRILKDQVREHLRPHGVMLVEIGYDIQDSVIELFKDTFRDISTVYDYGNNPRVVILTNLINPNIGEWL